MRLSRKTARKAAGVIVSSALITVGCSGHGADGLTAEPDVGDGSVAPNVDGGRGLPDSASNPDGGPGPRDGAAEASADGRVPDAAKPDAEPPPPPGPQLANKTLVLQGKSRSYLLVTPGVVDPKISYPIIYLFHGDGGGTGAGMHASFPLETVTGNAAILVFPDGLGSAGFGGSWDIENPVAKNYDYPLIPAITAAIGGKFKVATNRVFGFGFSNGGFFVNKASCVVPGIFRAIVSNSGGQPYNGGSGGGENYAKYPNNCLQCPGKVPSFIVHGVDDGVVSFDTGKYEAACQATVNGCTSSTVPSAQAPSPCVDYVGCGTGYPLTFCAIPSMGHQLWPPVAAAGWEYFKSFQ